MTWWPFVLLGLAAYRVWRLLAQDSILDAPRRRLSPGAGSFVECCWCLGFWVAVAWWTAWLFWPHATTWAAVPFSLSATLGLIASRDGSDD